MKKWIVAAAAAGLILILLAAPLVAQSTAGGKTKVQTTFTVTFQVNVPGAAIFVDKAQIQGNTVKVPPGGHSFRVVAPGYHDFIQNANVTANMTVNVQLQPQSFPLTINANIKGALIFVDGAQVKGNVVTVSAGTHSIRVSANGFQDFNTTVNVSAPMVIDAQLQQAGFPLTINTNVKGALIFVDGAQVMGNVASVSPGSHTIRVTADGYQDFNTSVNIYGPFVINAQLTQAGYALTVTGNVTGAAVFINNVQRGVIPYTEMLPPGTYGIRVTASGYQDYNTTVNVNAAFTVNAQLAAMGYPLTITANLRTTALTINNIQKGGTPYTEVLPPGMYTIVVSAPGYADYVATVNLSSPLVINAVLQPGMATLSIVIPPSFLDPEDKGEGFGLVKIFVDGKMMNPKRDVSGIQVTPGKHRIVVSSGALFVQLGDFDFAAGQSYAIDLYMELRPRVIQK